MVGGNGNSSLINLQNNDTMILRQKFARNNHILTIMIFVIRAVFYISLTTTNGYAVVIVLETMIDLGYSN